MTLAARAQAIADRARESAPAKREQRRRDMPGTAAFWDELVSVFGKPQWMRMEEGGRVVEYGERTVTGVAYPASASCKPGKAIKERR